MSALDVESLQVRYGGVEAVSGVTLHVEPGQCTAIVGANGAGKTSLLRGISGLVGCSRTTRIWVEGERVDSRPAHQRARLGVGHVLQERHLFPTLTVRENLELGRQAVRGRRPSEESLQKVLHLFPELERDLGRPAASLSGGQQQYLAIGRALMGEPRLLLLDEPSLGLAPLLVVRIGEALAALRDEGLTIVLVEQMLSLVERLAGVVHILSHGSLLGQVDPASEDFRETVHRHYLS